MLKVGKRFCNKLNKLIPFKSQEDRDKLNELIFEMCDHEEGDIIYNEIYWDRDLYIDCNGDYDKLRDMVANSDKVMFEPTDDPKEHPGVRITYKPNYLQRVFL